MQRNASCMACNKHTWFMHGIPICIGLNMASYRITSVVNWLLRVGDAGKLKADERALFLLIGAPLL